MGNESSTKCETPPVCDVSECCTPCEMLRTFWGRTMYPMNVLLVFWVLVFTVLAVYSAVAFFHAEGIRYQIMFATLFACSFCGAMLTKVFGWMLILRHGAIRAIKGLEARVEECFRSCQPKP